MLPRLKILKKFRQLFSLSETLPYESVLTRYEVEMTHCNETAMKQPASYHCLCNNDAVCYVGQRLPIVHRVAGAAMQVQ